MLAPGLGAVVDVEDTPGNGNHQQADLDFEEFYLAACQQQASQHEAGAAAQRLVVHECRLKMYPDLATQ